MGKDVKTELIKKILPAKEKNILYQTLSLALTLLKMDSQTRFFLGLPPASNPRYLNGTLIIIQ